MSKSLRKGLSVFFLVIFVVFTAYSTENKRLDFDGDGKSDISLYNRVNGGFNWTIKASGNGILYSQRFGISEDLPAPGDYNGDGKTEYGVFRPSNGTWYNSTTTFPNPLSTYDGVQWGLSGDIPVQGDYDGDTKTDRAVFRPSNGTWYVLKSSGGYIFFQWGANGDRPVPQDFDNDGKTDFAVVRNVSGSLIWYVYRSSDNSFQAYQFGLSSDLATVSSINGNYPTIYRLSNFEMWYRYSSQTYNTVQIYGSNYRGIADYDGDGSDDFGDWVPSEGRFLVIPWNHLYSPYNIYFGIVADNNLASIYFY